MRLTQPSIRLPSADRFLAAPFPNQFPEFRGAREPNLFFIHSFDGHKQRDRVPIGVRITRSCCASATQVSSVEASIATVFVGLILEQKVTTETKNSGIRLLIVGGVVGVERQRAAALFAYLSGKVLLTDGPSAETTEHLGGFIVIEAGDQRWNGSWNLS